MKYLILALFIFSCSHSERRVSSTEEVQGKLQRLFESTDSDPLLDRNEFMQKKQYSYLVCKEKGTDQYSLAIEPLGTQGVISIKSKYDKCQEISRAEFKNHQS